VVVGVVGGLQLAAAMVVAALAVIVNLLLKIYLLELHLQ
jgi:hypothetical protein